MCHYNPAICQGCTAHSFSITFGSAVACLGLETFSHTRRADLCGLIHVFFVFDCHECVGRSRANVTVICGLTIHLNDLNDPSFGVRDQPGMWIIFLIPAGAWGYDVICCVEKQRRSFVWFIWFFSLNWTKDSSSCCCTNIRLIFPVFRCCRFLLCYFLFKSLRS